MLVTISIRIGRLGLALASFALAGGLLLAALG